MGTRGGTVPAGMGSAVMIGDDETPADDAFTDWLAAYHEALAIGTDLSAPARGMAPDLAARVERGIAALRVLDGLGLRAAGDTGTAPTLADPPSGSGLTSVPPWRTLGRFRIRRELGRGGCGIVYLAHDPLLNRDVALKVPRAELAASPDVRARFAREARAAAGLEHPHLVPVFEAGEVGPVCFLVSAYCPGLSLARWLKRHPEPIPFRAAVSLVACVADAVQHAHDRGVLHRDLKPSNILLDIPSGIDASELGELFPRVTDFGLAKMLTQGPDNDVTQSGAIVGTANYMAPEQAAGRSHHVGPAGDVYALGAILYELLTHRPPLLGDSDLDTIRLVREEEPLPPSRLRPRLPRDLETICLKCLQKEPHRRYSHASALAADLGRFLGGEPIRARPFGMMARIERWCRKRPALAAASVLAVAAAATSVTLAICFALSQQRAASTLRHEQELTRAALKLAEARSVLAERSFALLTLEKGLAFCKQAQVRPGLLWMARSLNTLSTLPIADAADLDDAIRINLADWGASVRALTNVFPHDGQYRCAIFNPKGDRVLIAGTETAQVWDVKTGRPWGRRLSHRGEISAAAFSPDGRTILTGSLDHSARLWDADTCSPRYAPMSLDGPVRVVRFSPDGETALIAGDTGQALLWNVASARPQCPALDHGAGIRSAVFSPNGNVVLTGGADGKAKRWDAATGRSVCEPLLHRGALEVVAFDSEGGSILTAGRDGIARLWDLNGHMMRELTGHGDAIVAAAFSPDGQTVVTGSLDHTAQLWKVATGSRIGEPMTHQGGVVAVAFSPDGHLVAIAGLDTAVDLWDVETGRLVCGSLTHRGAARAVVFSSDGQRLLTAADDGTARLWDAVPARSWDAARSLPLPHRNAVECAVLCPDGRFAATGDRDGTARIWAMATGERFGGDMDHGEPIENVVFLDRRTLLTIGGNRVRRWRTTNGQPIGEAITPPNLIVPGSIVASPDGRTIALGCVDGTVLLYDALSTRLRPRRLHHADRVTTVRFSPDGQTLMTASFDKTALLWDARTGDRSAVLRHDGRVTAATFSPDGRRVATAASDGRARLWSVEKGALLGYVQHEGIVWAVSFSPDGSRLVTGSGDNNARIWDLHAGKQAILRHWGPVRAVAFSPDSRRLLTGGGDAYARLWDTATGLPLGPARRYAGSVTFVAFSADNHRFLTLSNDGAACFGRLADALKGDAERITRRAEMLTGMELDADGLERVLTGLGWHGRQRLDAEHSSRASHTMTTTANTAGQRGGGPGEATEDMPLTGRTRRTN
jgi:eukaryotic-like serine/threonine-protein kinase